MKDLIRDFHDNKNKFIEIIKYIKPVIKKYSQGLNYYCAESDLIIFLYQLVSDIELSNFPEDFYLENYINRSLKREFIRLNKKKKEEKYIIVSSRLVDIEINTKNSISLEKELFEFNDLIRFIAEKDRELLTYRYYHLLSDNEIAVLLNISRQAVYKRRIAALRKLKSIMQN